jgi:hypothetical protein
MVTQASHYCIENKLRTFLGGAQQTFEAFEDTLTGYLKGLQILDIDRAPTYLSRMSLYVQFLDILEKHINHAFNGSELQDKIPNSPALLFFSKNKKVCMDWFMRMRKDIVFAAFEVGCEDVMVSHVIQGIKEKSLLINALVNANKPVHFIEEQKKELNIMVERCLSYLSKTRESGLLDGVCCFLRSTLPSMFPQFVLDSYYELSFGRVKNVLTMMEGGNESDNLAKSVKFIHS